MNTYRKHNLRWEENSRTKLFVALGILGKVCLVPKTTHDKFPEDCATVRLKKPLAKAPIVSVYFKGTTKRATACFEFIPSKYGLGLPSDGRCVLSGELDLNLWPIDMVDSVAKVICGAFEDEQLKMETTEGVYNACKEGAI